MRELTKKDRISLIRHTIKDIERLVDLEEKGVTTDPLGYEPWCEDDDGTVSNHLVMSVSWLMTLAKELREFK